MQEQPRSRRAAVEAIPSDRHADVRELSADLMGAPGFEPHVDQRSIAGPLEHAVVTDGAFSAAGDDPHPTFTVGFELVLEHAGIRPRRAPFAG